VNVFDASALLAFLQGEPGAGLVQKVLNDGPACGAANWSEVAQKIRAHGRNWDLAKALLATYGMKVEPVTAADAEWAAERWTSGEGLSLADRLCMALGYRLSATVWTADQAWGSYGQIRQIC
jgi:ribonuclease VapC